MGSHNVSTPATSLNGKEGIWYMLMGLSEGDAVVANGLSISESMLE